MKERIKKAIKLLDDFLDDECDYIGCDKVLELEFVLNTLRQVEKGATK